MRIDYRWLAAVVLALVVGFVAGRMKESDHDRGSLAGGAVRDGKGQMDSEWVGASERARSKRSKHHRERRVKSREQELRDILSDANLDESDPFYELSLDTGHPAWAKLCVWVMSASRSDFPGIMDVAEKTGSRADVEQLLLQRWSQLDPGAALEWVQLKDQEEDGAFTVDAPVVIIQEVFLHDPQWAVAKLKNIYVERKLLSGDELKPDDELDPFGDSTNRGMNLNILYRRLAMMPAQQRQALRESLGDELLEFGKSGWLSGMAAQAAYAGLDAVAAEVSDPETGVVDTGFVEATAFKDWEGAKQWVEQKGGGYGQDSAIWSYANEEDRHAVTEWYLARSADAGDRARRLADVLGSMKENEAGLKWVLEMEAAGEPVEHAWASLINRMVSKGDIQSAEIYLPKLQNDQLRQASVRRIYDKMSHKNWGEVEYFTISRDYREQALVNPGFRDYVISKNREALKRLSTIVDGVERELSEK